jgi:hypothetical protein
VKEKERENENIATIEVPRTHDDTRWRKCHSKGEKPRTCIDMDESKSKLMEITADELNRAWRERME